MLEVTTISLQDVINKAHHQKISGLFTMARPTLTVTETAVDDSAQPEGLMDILNNAKKAPSTTSVVTVLNSIDSSDMQNLQDISLLDTYISVAASLIMYKANPKGWDITDPVQAADFTKKLTNARFQVLTQGLAGFLSIQDSASQAFDKSTTTAELHLEFLSGMFGSFGFSDSAMKQLDSIMTSLVDSLKSLQMSWSDESSSIDHLISLYYFEKVMGLDVKVPMMRIFYLHIDQKSWTASIGKSSVSNFEFHMNYTDNKAAMSLSQMAQSRQIIQDYVTGMTKQSLETIKVATQPVAIKTDTNA